MSPALPTGTTLVGISHAVAARPEMLFRTVHDSGADARLQAPFDEAWAGTPLLVQSMKDSLFIEAPAGVIKVS